MAGLQSSIASLPVQSSKNSIHAHCSSVSLADLSPEDLEAFLSTVNFTEAEFAILEAAAQGVVVTLPLSDRLRGLVTDGRLNFAGEIILKAACVVLAGLTIGCSAGNA